MKLRTRKTKTSAKKPIAKVNTAMAICWPTEYAAARPPKTLTRNACVTPAPWGVNGTAAPTAWTPSTSSTFLTEPPILNASSISQNAVKRNTQPASCMPKTSRR